jgi:hypothetical protein
MDKANEYQCDSGNMQCRVLRNSKIRFGIGITTTELSLTELSLEFRKFRQSKKNHYYYFSEFQRLFNTMTSFFHFGSKQIHVFQIAFCYIDFMSQLNNQ